MAIDQPLRDAVEKFTAALRQELDARARQLADSLVSVAKDGEDKWQADLGRQLNDVRAEAERTLEARLNALRGELSQQMEQRLTAQRSELGQQADQRLAAQRDELSQQASQRLTAQRDELAQQADQRLAAQHSELTQQHDERLATQRGELTQQMDQRLAAQREDHSTAMSKGIRQAGTEMLSRVLGGVRRLDEAESLQTILEALAAGAAAVAGRAAILLADGDRLQVWGHVGFPPDATPDGASLSDVEPLADAVAQKQMSLIKGPAADTSTPSFMRVPAGHTGLIIPVIVGTEVVALVYANDAGKPAGPDEAPSWVEELEVLVRHASLRLETVTSVRTVELLSGPA